MNDARPNIHATAFVVADKGILILGASGAGKTTLALAMLHRARMSSRHAALVADDQLFLEAAGGHLIVHAPGTIAGLVEVYGLGPCAVDFRATAAIDLVAELNDEGEGPRYQDVAKRVIAGVALPWINLPLRKTHMSAGILAAHLHLPPFAG